jgi:hypothetical protein
MPRFFLKLKRFQNRRLIAFHDFKFKFEKLQRKIRECFVLLELRLSKIVRLIRAQAYGVSSLDVVSLLIKQTN